MGAIKSIVDTLATAVKGIVDTATQGVQGGNKMNLGDSSCEGQGDQADTASQAGNTLMDRELARLQGMQMQQMAQSMANQQGGNNGAQGFGGIRG